MGEVKHTPGPWRTDPDFPADIQTSDGSVDVANAGCAADFENAPPEPEMLANAAFIVRACNAHDDLVASLAEMVDAYGSDDGGGPIDIIERAKAALAKATGEAPR